ncbi:Origin recognition complex subunit 2 [Lecanicillium sp. MT-2017a]|nr:Origin recognition complex subunit 2 [Lecanicillium sp. MT-2017a]
MPRRKSIQDDAESSTEAEQVQDTVPMAIDTEEPPAKRRRSSEPRDADESMTEEDTTLTNGSSHHDAAITHTNGADEADSNQPDTPVVTPRKRGRPPKKTPTKPPNTTSTPTKSIPAPSFLTPLKAAGPNATTPGRNAADRSARRKTARSLLEHATGDIGSDDDDAADQDEEQLAREIFGYSDAEDDDEDEDEGTSIGDGLSEAASEAATSAAATPTKTRKPRKRAKSPTPPRDLPPHEMYFFHNKPGRPKTSDNTLAGLRLLTHDEYFEVLKTQSDPHAEDVRFLEALHAESFPQWSFELSQGFSLCLYGFGSKRGLLRQFATHIHTQQSESDTSRIVMINGYAPTANIREILTCVNNAIDSSRKLPAGTPAAMAQNLTQHLSSMSSPPSLTLVVNSIDALPLRKTASNAQGILAHLASHPRVSLVCSADSADFPLLWDIGVRSAFNFAFHDCTTFAPFLVELDAVDEVHELLGRKAHRVNGREGVAFVLKSLPENARNLFRLLVGEVLIAMDDDGDGGSEDAAAGGVEYRMVYNKAVEEFVCSSEMAFRTLLKEFHDHQIITSRKDALGTELLSVPFRREELEAILEDLMS